MNQTRCFECKVETNDYVKLNSYETIDFDTYRLNYQLQNIRDNEGQWLPKNTILCNKCLQTHSFKKVPKVQCSYCQKYYRNIFEDHLDSDDGSKCSAYYDKKSRTIICGYGSGFDDNEFKIIDSFNTQFLEHSNSNLCDYCIYNFFINGVLQINRYDDIYYLKSYIHDLLKQCQICFCKKLEMFKYKTTNDKNIILFWKHKLYKINFKQTNLFNSPEGSICKECRNNLSIEPYLSVECSLCQTKYQSDNYDERYHLSKDCATYFFKEDLLLYSLTKIKLYKIEDLSGFTLNEKSIICDCCVKQLIADEKIKPLKNNEFYLNKYFSYWIFGEFDYHDEPPSFSEFEKKYISDEYLESIEKKFIYTEEEIELMNKFRKETEKMQEEKNNFIEELLNESPEYQSINLKEYCNDLFKYLYL